MRIVYTDGGDGRFVELCQELDRYLNVIVGGEKQRKQYYQYNTLVNIHDVVLIMEGDTAVACGGFKEYAEGIAEIKRVFTKEKYRNRGYGKAVMKVLESRAKKKGYQKLILETGEPLKAAMKMYRDSGFHIIKNYGPYADMPESVCMEKNII